MTVTAATARPLEGRHVLVTGAAQGIGAAIAQTLARQGAVLTLAGRSKDKLEVLAQQLDARTCCVSMDVGSVQSVAQGFADARAALGPITLLVNNAGQAESAPFGKTSQDLWQRMLDVNLTGTFLCMQAAPKAQKA